MEGKLIVIESGTDSSGKETQTRKLYDRLVKENYNVRKIEFPDYGSKSSALIKMYLNGEFGDRAGDVNPFAASTFYAVDRFASFQKEWKSFIEDGGIVIADRYTTSNMVHQAAKFGSEQEKNSYLDWLWDLEFEKYQLPIPNLVILLDMPPEKSQELMKDRKNKFTNNQIKDIHEKDYNYLKQSYQNACWVADKYNWNRVECIKDNKLKTIEEIHQEIYSILEENNII